MFVYVLWNVCLKHPSPFYVVQEDLAPVACVDVYGVRRHYVFVTHW